MSNYYTCNITAQEIELHAWLHVYIMAAICCLVGTSFTVHIYRVKTAVRSMLSSVDTGIVPVI